jgi:hypothetical protein
MVRQLMFIVALSGCSNAPAPRFQSNCTAGAITDEAKVPAGMMPDGTAILPGGRKISPAVQLD